MTDRDRAEVGAGPVEVLRIGWRRARSFNVLNPGARSWTGVLIAPWVWPLDALVVGVTSGKVRRRAGASLTLTGGTSLQVQWLALLAAVAVTLAYLAVMLAVSVPLALVLLGPLSPGWAAVAALAIVCGPLLVELSARVLRLLRSPQVRSLPGRRRELAESTGAPVFVMSFLVRSNREGEGSRLLEVLREEWQETGAVVLLNPANEAVADYYAAHGAVPDGDDRRVMRFDYRAAIIV